MDGTKAKISWEWRFTTMLACYITKQLDQMQMDPKNREKERIGGRFTSMIELEGGHSGLSHPKSFHF